MSNSKSNGNYTVAVLVIILLLSLLNTTVIGKPLLGSPVEESPNFESTDSDKTHLMEEKLIKRDPSGENHLSDAVQPLIRLLRLQNMDDTTDPGMNTVRPRARYGKRTSTLFHW